MKNHVKVWENLNDLIQINRDRIKGYEQAINELEPNNYLTSIFRAKAKESRTYVDELNNAVTRIGHHPETKGTVLGTIHRTWMDVKNSFTSNQKEAVLENCEFGDKAALAAYDEVLKDENVSIPVWVRSIVLKQRQGLQLAYDQISTLESAFDEANS